MEEVVLEIRKILRLQKLREECFWVLIVLLIVIGIAGVIASSVMGKFNYLPVFCIIGFVLPIVFAISAVIGIVKNSSNSNKINDILLDNKLSADEIMSVGKRLNINLFSLALTVRCKELGLSKVPEWCVRDSVLPTKKEVN